MKHRGALPTSCPACGGRIRISGGCDDGARSGWSCSVCMAFSFAQHDSPEITRGKKLKKELEGVHFMDKAITSLPANVQIGILRARQHPEENEEYQ